MSLPWAYLFTLNINPPDKSPSSPYRRCRATLVSRSRVSSTPPFIDDRSTWSAAKCRHQLSYHPAGWRVLVLADPGLLRRDSHPLGTLRSCCCCCCCIIALPPVTVDDYVFSLERGPRSDPRKRGQVEIFSLSSRAREGSSPQTTAPSRAPESLLWGPPTLVAQLQ